MRKSLLCLLAIVVFCSGQMCVPLPAPPPPPCLTMDNVTSIPPGDATGTGFSGVYRPVSIVQESCQKCDNNTVVDAACEPPIVYADQRVTLSQADGFLSLDDNADIMTGGIDQDGTFSVGTVAAAGILDGKPTGQALVRIDAAFVGNRIIGTITWRITINGRGYVGDVQAVNTCTYERIDDSDE